MRVSATTQYTHIGTVPVIGLYEVTAGRLYEAIEMKLLMVKTVAQCVKIKIDLNFLNNKFVYELWAVNEGHASH